jgi:NAD(P)-dependent dehydrogenase (short-subunit alcohol dehydrogenase family)
MMRWLDGRIGLAAARSLVAEGAHVFITARRQEELDAAVKDIGSSATAVRGDAGNLADVDRLFDTIKTQAGRLDVLVANAGIYEIQPLSEVTKRVSTRPSI